ncbi:MAG: HAMP domain-containing histidine kinase [Desulfovibrio sp.]|jgi:signal transduction histidine kinase|nr:HAMP domain-containing histidine kinase [Desulfovibrio sp.]
MDTADRRTGASAVSQGAEAEIVRARISTKIEAYRNYAFTDRQARAMNIFFDLAQEFEEIRQVHILAVLVLDMLFDYKAGLYIRNEAGRLTPVDTGLDVGAPAIGDVRDTLWRAGGFCYVPVHGKAAGQTAQTGEDLLGLLVLREQTAFPEHTQLFLQKYANRLGYCLHNKLMAANNIGHLRFLRKLSKDIGHNIITPNMRLKHQLNLFKANLGRLDERLAVLSDAGDAAVFQDILALRKVMDEQFAAVTAGFNNSALFMESLMRQSHFDLGHFVLRIARLDMGKSIVAPQVERYRYLFEERGVEMEGGRAVLPDEPCFVEADYGLISQVLANLLSNAAKYASPAPGSDRRRVHCSLVKDGCNAKVIVFSTGPHIAPEEAVRLFDDDYRASNAAESYGTGHGLFFVRDIMENHKGTAGYEPAPGGNNFYFTLPLAPQSEQDA